MDSARLIIDEWNLVIINKNKKRTLIKYTERRIWRNIEWTEIINHA